MDIFVGSDESGTFSENEGFFVFGGVIALGGKSKESLCRRFASVETLVREQLHLGRSEEVKASRVGGKWKGKIYRSLNGIHKFAVAIRLPDINPYVFASKKTKQRYMDFAYKVGLRFAFETLIEKGLIDPGKVHNVIVQADEHSTATNGLYELSEGLLAELKLGTFNQSYEIFFPPVFPDLHDVKVDFCDSKSKAMVRMADFVANHVYNAIRFGCLYDEGKRNLYLKFLPKNWSMMDVWPNGKENSTPDSFRASPIGGSTTRRQPRTEWRRLRKPSKPGSPLSSTSTLAKTASSSSSTIPPSSGSPAKKG